MGEYGQVVIENKGLLAEDFLKVCQVLHGLDGHVSSNEKMFVINGIDLNKEWFSPYFGTLAKMSQWYVGEIHWRLERNFSNRILEYLEIVEKIEYAK